MTTPTRQQVVSALLTRLTSTDLFLKYGQRLRDTESIPANKTPALYLKTISEEYDRPSPSEPPLRRLNVEAFIYIDVSADENAVPDAVYNGLKDSIDALMQPDDLLSGRCTLGGLVYSAMVKGKVLHASADVQGVGGLIIPIEIILP